MSDFTFDDMERGWPELMDFVLERGAESTPRGFATRERLGVSFTLTDPSRAVVYSSPRDLNQAFCAAEFCWVAAGDDDVETLAFFNSNMRQFADQDKVVTSIVPGSGCMLHEVTPNARFFGAYGPPIVEQLPYVFENLRAPDSRQAVISIWRRSPPKTKDVPCTLSLQFLLRGGKLNLQVVMRSNDLWLGTPYDVPLFCRVQSWVASKLGVPVGTYQHFAGSLHLYERDYDAARACIRGGHRGLRPDNLVIGPFNAATDPTVVWGAVKDVVAGRDSLPLRDQGWHALFSIMEEYAARKLARKRG